MGYAVAAIVSGLCKTVLITHGESGRSGVGRTCNVLSPTSLAGQFEQPYGPMGPPTLLTIPVLRYMSVPSPPRRRGPRGRRRGPRRSWVPACAGTTIIHVRATGDGLGRAARRAG